MSNFACPECGVTLRHGSRWCAGCGWGKGSSRKTPSAGYEPVNAEQYAERMKREAEFSAECLAWLDENGVTQPGMTQPQRMKAMAAYRAMLKSTMRKSDVHPKAWAHSLKSDYLDGVAILPIQVAVASAALNEIWEKHECRPRHAVAA